MTSEEWGKITDMSNRDWGDIVAEKMSVLNPVCCFKFKRRWTKRSLKKSSNNLFKTVGMCTFDNCGVTFSVTVPTEDQSSLNKTALVTFAGQPCHSISERRARKIKASTRKELKEQFSLLSTPPSKMYHNSLHQLSGEVLLAGKRDKIGRTRHVLQKISSESRHIHERDPDFITSLRIMSEEENDESSKYIQCIQAVPFMVICFNETGVRLYHELAPSGTIYCDATGTIVSIPNKRVLYYAIVIQHPSQGKPPIAVAEMVGTDHSVNGLVHFIRTFRRLEGKIYGFGNVIKPGRVIIDRSLVLLIAFLEVYNGETVSQYLHRCFKIVTGAGEHADFSRLFPHACKSHMMKSAKDLSRKR